MASPSATARRGARGAAGAGRPQGRGRAPASSRFEALYQNGLHALTSGIDGAAGVIVQLGPFGGASNVGAAIRPWAVAWSAAVVALAALAFRRRDL